MGIFRSIDEFRQTAHRAKEIPSVEASFRRLYLNQWISSEISWMPMSKWNECNKVIEEEKLKGKDCYVGLDLSMTTDLSSVNLEFKLEDETYAMISKSFIPENRVREKERIDRVPYSEFIRQGILIPTPGDVIDYSYIKKYILEQAKLYNIKEICYDPWSASQLATELENEGFIVVAIRQGYQTMSEPTKDILALVLQKKLIHNNNPLLTWAIHNAVVRQDVNGNIMLDKSKARNRIDPAVAMVISHVRARSAEKEVDLNKIILNGEFSL